VQTHLKHRLDEREEGIAQTYFDSQIRQHSCTTSEPAIAGARASFATLHVAAHTARPPNAT